MMDINQMKQVIRSDFGIIADDIPPFTGKDRKRHTTHRVDIYKLFKKFEFKIGAEIGVRRGGNAVAICKQIPHVKFYLVDPWPKESKRFEKYYQWTKEKTQPYDVVLMRTTSMEAVKKFKDCSLDFVYIDAAHDFNNVMLDLIHWVPKVKIGGIVSGHDYRVFPDGVLRAVDSYVFAHGIVDLFCTREHIPSFFFIREK